MRGVGIETRPVTESPFLRALSPPVQLIKAAGIVGTPRAEGPSDGLLQALLAGENCSRNVPSDGENARYLGVVDRPGHRLGINWWTWY